MVDATESMYRRAQIGNQISSQLARYRVLTNSLVNKGNGTEVNQPACPKSELGNDLLYILELCGDMCT